MPMPMPMMIIVIMLTDVLGPCVRPQLAVGLGELLHTLGYINTHAHSSLIPSLDWVVSVHL